MIKKRTAIYNNYTMKQIYKVVVPPTSKMGSFTVNATASTNETFFENALWHYNKAREHDGLLPIQALPKGTTWVML